MRRLGGRFKLFVTRRKPQEWIDGIWQKSKSKGRNQQTASRSGAKSIKSDMKGG
jgi:hypothetical protein